MSNSDRLVRTDNQGRCLTCEGTGVYIEYEDDEMSPVDCPDCSGQQEA